MYDRILHPTDGSDAGNRAVRHAIELADTYDATLHVLSVINVDEFAALDGVDLESVRQSRSDAVTAIADRIAEADIDAVTEIRNGVPADEILAYADETDVDMIVMGTQGRSGVDRMLLGSITEAVVRRSTVPVVTVRLTGDAGPNTSEAAIEYAIDTLETQGHEGIELADEPHRTSGSWIVPLTADEGTFHVHVSTSDGETRIARLD